jgi:peptide/nickel transport system substrate-binding protein
VNALLSGQADAVSVVPNTEVQVVKANPKLRVLESVTASWNPITMRIDVAPFKDVRVRQAFRLLVNRTQFVEQVLSNNGSVANDLFALYDPDYDHAIPQRPYYLEQAKSLLHQAGQDNLSMEFITSPVVPDLVSAAQVFVQQATLAGVKIKLIQVDPSTFFDRYFLSTALSQSYWATRDYLIQAADSMMPSSPYNETHWKNSRWLSLVNQALASVDDQQRKQLIGEAQQIEWNEGGYINWGWFNIFDAYNERVHGLVPDRSGFSLTSYSLRQAWLSS